MSPERWRQVESVYNAAMEMEPSQREAFVSNATKEDSELRREVASLLAKTASQAGPLDQPVWQHDSILTETVRAQGISEGTQIGPYRILELLGSGGMGVVYKALDKKLNRPVAIKVLAKNIADDGARRRFQREAQMASALNHPHILTVHDAGEFNGFQYLVTEFVDGGTLKTWAEQPRTWREVLDLLIGVADGLGAAHSVGILHRDIKPANMLVSKNGYAKLADFGLAKLSDPGRGSAGTQEDGPTLPGMIVGTVAYMSPEQAAAQPIDARSDLFSFGVVLYEMLAQRRPFEGKDNIELMREILACRPDPLPEHLPDSLRRAIDKTLMKDAAERYQSTAELIADLKQVQRLDGEESVPEGLAAGARNHRWLIFGIAAAVVLAVLGILWHLRRIDFFWQNPLSGARIERITDFEGDEQDAAISSDGKLFAFLSDRDGQFDTWVGQIGNNEFVNITGGRFKVDPGHIRRTRFTPDSSRVWFLDGDGRQHAYAGWLAPVVGATPTPFLTRAMEVDWSTEGHIAYHTDDPGDPIFVADSSGGNARRVYVEKPGSHCHYLTWSMDGQYIYFTKGNPSDEMDLWRISVSGSGEPERITHHGASVATPSWLDERTLIYSVPAEEGSGRWLHTVDVNRRIPHRVTFGVTEQYLSVAVSSTTPRRHVCTVASGRASVWSIPVSDKIQADASASRLPALGSRSRSHGPRSCPGGLLFLSSLGDADGIWKLENNTVRELWKGRDGAVSAPPAISPDGKTICFYYRKHGRPAGLYLMDADGTKIRTLSESLEIRGSADWSPNGDWLAVAAGQNEGIRVYVVPSGGGAPRQLVHTTSYNPVWSPDGKFLVYSEPAQGGELAVKAITLGGEPISMPDLRVSYAMGTPYRFLPGGHELVFLKAGPERTRQFFAVDLKTGRERQLTDLKLAYLIQNFDVSRDGSQIVFDRFRDNSDVVLIELAR